MAKVAQLLGVTTPESVRTWVRQAQVDQGDRVGVSTEEAAGLKRENAELRRANSMADSNGLRTGAVIIGDRSVEVRRGGCADSGAEGHGVPSEG